MQTISHPMDAWTVNQLCLRRTNIQGVNGTLEPYLGRETLCCTKRQPSPMKDTENHWDVYLGVKM